MFAAREPNRSTFCIRYNNRYMVWVHWAQEHEKQPWWLVASAVYGSVIQNSSAAMIKSIAVIRIKTPNEFLERPSCDSVVQVR